jgi:hypothetical protein
MNLHRLFTKHFDTYNYSLTGNVTSSIATKSTTEIGIPCTPPSAAGANALGQYSEHTEILREKILLAVYCDAKLVETKAGSEIEIDSIRYDVVFPPSTFPTRGHNYTVLLVAQSNG